MKTLRLSYTLLSLWEMNKTQDAINYYLKKSTLSSPEITDGRIYDQVWQEEIDTKKELHIGRTLIKFKEPHTQVKIVCPYGDRFDLVGVIDCLDNETLYEWKSGTSSSLEYSDSPQVKMYFFICGALNIPVKTAIIGHYNQYSDKADITIFHNSIQQREEGENYIQSLSYEIWDYFSKHKII